MKNLNLNAYGVRTLNDKEIFGINGGSDSVLSADDAAVLDSDRWAMFGRNNVGGGCYTINIFWIPIKIICEI
jgi:hypothetical protein